MNETWLGAPAVQAHLERVDDELVAHVIGHRPAHDLAAIGVLDGGEIEPAFPGPQVGDIGEPEHVRLGRAKAPFDEVVSDANAGHTDRRAAALLRHKP
jgi:hypothetical protein